MKHESLRLVLSNFLYIKSPIVHNIYATYSCVSIFYVGSSSCTATASVSKITSLLWSWHMSCSSPLVKMYGSPCVLPRYSCYSWGEIWDAIVPFFFINFIMCFNQWSSLLFEHWVLLVNIFNSNAVAIIILNVRCMYYTVNQCSFIWLNVFYYIYLLCSCTVKFWNWKRWLAEDGFFF